MTLNPTSEAKQSLSRLRALEKAGSEGGARDAELTFLSHCSPCWNRSLTFSLFYPILSLSCLVLSCPPRILPCPVLPCAAFICHE